MSNTEKELKKQQKKKEKDNFRYLLKHTKIPWGLYILNMVLGIVLSLAFVLLPEVTGEIMAGNIMDSSIILLFAIGTAGASILGIIISVFEMWVLGKTDANIRKSVWDKIMRLPLKAWGGEEDAQISRVTNDPENMSFMISYCFSLVITTVTLAGILINVLSMDIRLFLMMLILIPWSYIASLPAKKMQQVQEKIQDSLSDYTEFVAEKLEKLRMIKAAGEEEKEYEINARIAGEQMAAEMKMAKWELIAQPVIYSMEAGVKAIALIYGGYLLSQHVIEADNAVTLFLYSGQITVNVMQYIFCIQYIKKSKGATMRIAEILQMEDEQFESKECFAFPDDTISFQDVSFAYPDGRMALSGVNCHIPNGKHTLIVGPSGAGKTTFLRLLARLYDPTSGSISIGAHNSADIHLNEWRESFSVIPQDSALMDGSLRDNLLYGVSTEVSQSRIDEVIEMVNLKDVIAAIGEEGERSIRDVSEKLSGGERQRIALARMLIRDAEFLIVDEATANLDVSNAAIVNHAIDQTKDGKTLIEVTHKIRTALTADHIIFMNKGSVEAEGSHSELYANVPAYRELFDASLALEAHAN